MIQALRDRQTGIMLLAAMAASGAAWWLLLAGPSMAQMFVCGVDGFGPVGGAWSAGRLLSLGGMWVVMASAMMVPAGAASSLFSPWGEDARRADKGATSRMGPPLIRPFGPSSPQGEKREPVALPFSFLYGYIAFFIAISIAAAVSQWTLESLGLIGEGGKIFSPLLAGALLAVIGLWHIAQLLRRHAPCGSIGSSQAKSLLQGWRHGCSSLGCCLTMVGLQFVAGTMNLWLMIGLTLWMLAEAFLPWKRELASATGVALLTAGGLSVMGAFG